MTKYKPVPEGTHKPGAGVYVEKFIHPEFGKSVGVFHAATDDLISHHSSEAEADKLISRAKFRKTQKPSAVRAQIDGTYRHSQHSETEQFDEHLYGRFNPSIAGAKNQRESNQHKIKFHNIVKEHGGRLLPSHSHGDLKFKIPKSRATQFHQAAKALGYAHGDSNEHPYSLGASQHSEEEQFAEKITHSIFSDHTSSSSLKTLSKGFGGIQHPDHPNLFGVPKSKVDAFHAAAKQKGFHLKHNSPSGSYHYSAKGEMGSSGQFDEVEQPTEREASLHLSGAPNGLGSAVLMRKPKPETSQHAEAPKTVQGRSKFLSQHGRSFNRRLHQILLQHGGAVHSKDGGFTLPKKAIEAFNQAASGAGFQHGHQFSLNH